MKAPIESYWDKTCKRSMLMLAPLPGFGAVGRRRSATTQNTFLIMETWVYGFPLDRRLSRQASALQGPLTSSTQIGLNSSWTFCVCPVPGLNGMRMRAGESAEVRRVRYGWLHGRHKYRAENDRDQMETRRRQ